MARGHILLKPVVPGPDSGRAVPPPRAALLSALLRTLAKLVFRSAVFDSAQQKRGCTVESCQRAMSLLLFNWVIELLKDQG